MLRTLLSAFALVLLVASAPGEPAHAGPSSTPQASSGSAAKPTSDYVDPAFVAAKHARYEQALASGTLCPKRAAQQKQRLAQLDAALRAQESGHGGGPGSSGKPGKK